MKKPMRRIPWWLIVLLIAALCIVIGVFQGDVQETFAKAARVCYECIGIG